MARTTPSTVVLQLNSADRPVYNDKKAAEAGILPGHLIQLASATTVEMLDTADKANARMVAVEAAWQSDDTANPAIDTAYDSGDTVSYIYAQPGDLLYLVLSVSQVASIGSILATSGTKGEVSVESTNTDQKVIGVAEEAVTTTAATARIKVRMF